MCRGTRDWARALDNDEVGTLETIEGHFGGPERLVIAEPGLYKLLARSRRFPYGSGGCPPPHRAGADLIAGGDCCPGCAITAQAVDAGAA